MKSSKNFLLLAALAVLFGTCAGAAESVSPDAILAGIAQRLLDRHEAFLDKPNEYKETVRLECALFPEGDLLPYVFPVLAYTNLALADPKHKATALKRIPQLVDLMIPAVMSRVHPPGDKLEDLAEYRQQAVYLGQLNLAMSAYRLAGGDDRYDKIHRNISRVLHEALVERKGLPLESYPSLTWSFDTMPCVLSLHLFDRLNKSDRSAKAIADHLQWVREKALDPKTRLPCSAVDGKTGEGKDLPRGCDLSLRICLLAQIDRTQAGDLYRNYVKSFWLDKTLLAGFAEWPGGERQTQDMDSGPVFMGIGMAATGFGLATCRAMNDATRFLRLAGELAMLDTLMPQLQQLDARSQEGRIGGLIDKKPGYVTGFLFGDACLFYAVTWREWTP